MLIYNLLKKYESVVRYLFFGICTTIVNIAVYFVCSRVCGMRVVMATSVAWIVSVVFAYITNRIWVFKSIRQGFFSIFKETVSFFACRLSTGFLDVCFMFVFVDILGCGDVVTKMFSNLIVIILNYVASKVFVFRNGSSH